MLRLTCTEVSGLTCGKDGSASGNGVPFCQTRSMAAKKKAATAKRTKTGRRELIDTGTNVRGNARGTSFKKVVDAGRSITADKRQKAKRKVPSGQGDRGDR
jgi:hypothetical protein